LGGARAWEAAGRAAATAVAVAAAVEGPRNRLRTINSVADNRCRRAGQSRKTKNEGKEKKEKQKGSTKEETKK